MRYFLVYLNGRDSESRSILYSYLVIATDEDDAIEKYCLQDAWGATPEDFGEVDPQYGRSEDCKYGILELTPIV